MNRRTLFALAAAAALSVTAGLPAHAADPLKVAFVYVGPVGDAGWTYAHEQGRLALKSRWPGKSRRPTSRTCRKARTPSA
jgi:basic membrane protein A